MIYFIAWVVVGFIASYLLWVENHKAMVTDPSVYFREANRNHNRWAYLRGFFLTVGLGPISFGMYLKRSEVSLIDKVLLFLGILSLTWIILATTITINGDIIYKGPFAGVEVDGTTGG
jgi:hypothetical protein